MLNGSAQYPSPAKALSDALKGAGSGGKYMARCPAHDDRTASLSIGEGKDGQLLLNCHAGCEYATVRGLLEQRGLLPETEIRAELPTIYTYVDEVHQPLLEVVRRADKKFHQQLPGGVRGSVKGVRIVPYRLPEIMEAIALPCPVFVVEGEKDADRLAKFGIAATCNAGGTGMRWRPEHSAFLHGADVIVIPDNDEPGRKHAEKVAKSVTEAGAVRVRVLAPFDVEGKKGSDVSDWLNAGGTVEALWALVERTQNWRPGRRVASDEDLRRAEEEAIAAEEAAQSRPARAVSSGDWLPSDGFKIHRDGSIFYSAGEDAEGGVVWRFLCSPFEVAARTSDGEKDDHGRLLRIYDELNDYWHEWAMPMRLLSGDVSAFLGDLFGMGLRVSLKAKTRMADLVMMARPTRKAVCVDQIGWHGGAFAMPSCVFSRSGQSEVVFQSRRHVRGGNFSTRGTLDGWRQNIAAPAAGNSRLVFAISAAFAGPCLFLVGDEGGGIHFHDKSSTGKTTALRVAGSVWGGGGAKGFVSNWRSTTNALEGRARAHSDTLLCLEEIGQGDPDAVLDSAYLFANGAGRGRLTAEAQLKQTPEWRLLFISDGEKSFTQLAEESSKKKIMAGQLVRVLDIPADAGQQRGLFDDLKGHTSGREFSEHLKLASARDYGTAAPAFLERLVADTEGATIFLLDQRDSFLLQNAAKSAAQVQRVAKKFGLIAAAGELAVKWGILPWEAGEATKQAKACFKVWLAARGTSGQIEVRQGIEHVRQFILRDGVSRFSPWEAPAAAAIRDRVGFVQYDAAQSAGNKATYFVLAPAWKTVCGGFDAAEVARALRENGVLEGEQVKGTDKWKTSKSIKLPAIGQARCYVIDAEKLFDEALLDEGPFSGVSGVSGVSQ